MTEFASAATRRKNSAARLAIGLLAGTMLAGMPAAAFAQDEDAATPSPAPAPATPQDGEAFVPTLAPAATAQQDVVHIFPLQQRAVAVFFIGEAVFCYDDTSSFPIIRD